MRVVYFLEDRAQEGLVTALVARVAREEGIPEDAVNHDIRSARHGAKALEDFRRFITDSATEDVHDVAFLLVMIDGNCQTRAQRLRQLEAIVPERYPLLQSIVYAVADPHVERWYLMDQAAWHKAIGGAYPPQLPQYKCDQDYYKHLLADAVRDSGVSALLGGTEFGAAIVEAMEDLNNTSYPDGAFTQLVHDLRHATRSKVHGARGRRSAGNNAVA